MALTVLSDKDVKSLLARLEPTDIYAIISTYSAALQAYSIGEESRYQCHRQGITRPGGPTMLFMPATLPGASSVKVVGVPPPTTTLQDKDKAENKAKTQKSDPIVGAILVFDAVGRATGLVNAAETTAFRTSLGSILLYAHRNETSNIVVFGAGKQALWHLRLALVLKRGDIKTVTIVNRSADRAKELIERLHEMDAAAGSGHRDNDVEFSILEAGSESKQDEALKEAVTRADVIFCTTPSTQPLFPAEWLTASTGSTKTRFISAIGSYKLDMQELDPALLQAVVAEDGPRSYFPPVGQHKTDDAKTTSGSIIVVDTREGCALEAGELVKAEIEAERIVEVGELTHILENRDNNGESERLEKWLAGGNVVYKSVGMGIMDLSICQALLERAAVYDVGTKLDEF